MCKSNSENNEVEAYQYFTRYRYKTRDRLTSLNLKQIKGLGQYINKIKEAKRLSNNRKVRF